MRRAVAALAAFALLSSLPSPAHALDGKKAVHVGGTLTALVPAETEGVFNTTDEEKLIFLVEESFATIEIPYAKIDTFEYGQKASSRIKSVLTPWALFSKKRRHFLSVVYKDREDKDQAVVFELGKDILRMTVLVMEARAHKKMEFQDEESRKNFAR
jgi:hypothetical protein